MKKWLNWIVMFWSYFKPFFSIKIPYLRKLDIAPFANFQAMQKLGHFQIRITLQLTDQYFGLAVSSLTWEVFIMQILKNSNLNPQKWKPRLVLNDGASLNTYHMKWLFEKDTEAQSSQNPTLMAQQLDQQENFFFIFYSFSSAIFSLPFKKDSWSTGG